MDIKGERMLDGRYEAEGKLSQHLKDVDLMLEVGHAAGAPMMATALHRQLLLAGAAAGGGERDNSSIMAVLRSLVGLPDGAPRPDPARTPGAPGQSLTRPGSAYEIEHVRRIPPGAEPAHPVSRAKEPRR